MKWVVLVLALLTAVGCSAKYRTDAYQPPSQRLQKEPVYVMLPEDGAYARKVYAGSGRAVSAATAAAVSKYVNRVDVASATERTEEALAKAKTSGFRYVFEPQILNWEDHATEWSGKTDKITIKLVVWDTTNGKDVASTVARSSSKWGTLGGDHPQDLLPETMANFVDKLF